MVDVQGNIAVVGHMGPPYATTLLNVADPAKPSILARIPVYPGTRSHKARLCGNILAINVERLGNGGDEKAGMAFFNVADPRNPRETAILRTGGSGVHRFQMDCRRKLIYAGANTGDYAGSIPMIIDFTDPARPREIGRWQPSAQHPAAAEILSRHGPYLRTHHPLRLQDRLYISLWYDGFAILDISDIARPHLVSLISDRPASGAPTHTALPVGHAISGRRWLVVFDEEMGGGDPPAFMRMYDITDETKPSLVSTFQAPRTALTGGRFGAHQPHEFVGPDNLVYAAWFSGGLRVIDISNPDRPQEVGHYIPRPHRGERFAQSNDVFVDHRGMIYLIDRVRGLDILRLTLPK